MLYRMRSGVKIEIKFYYCSKSLFVIRLSCLTDFLKYKKTTFNLFTINKEDFLSS